MKRLQALIVVFLAVIAIGIQSDVASAAVIVVNGLGVNGWNSNDTHPPAGGPASPAQIAAQIVFMHEGQSVVDAAGAMPGAGPLGSLNGAGYVRLDGTNHNDGKSDLSFIGNLGSTSSLLGAGFSVSYSYYNDPNPTTRTVGLNIEVVNNLGTYASLIFSHVDPTNVADTWQINDVDQTSLFRLYGGPGAPGGMGPSLTIAAWLADPTFGPYLTGGAITRVGFNLGSGQKSNLTYLDWVQTNLLNNGDLIDFQGPAAAPVPEPASIAVWSLLAAAGGVSGWRKRKKLLKQA